MASILRFIQSGFWNIILKGFSYGLVLSFIFFSSVKAGCVVGKGAVSPAQEEREDPLQRFFLQSFFLTQDEPDLLSEHSGTLVNQESFLLAQTIFSEIEPVENIVSALTSQESSEALGIQDDKYPLHTGLELATQSKIASYTISGFVGSLLSSDEQKQIKDFLFEHRAKSYFLDALKQIKIDYADAGHIQQVYTFISYAWPKKPEEQGLQPFLMDVVRHSKQAGIHTQLDLFELKPGSDITAYMHQGILKSKTTFLIGAPTLKDRTFDPKTNISFEVRTLLESQSSITPLLYCADSEAAYPPSVLEAARERGWIIYDMHSLYQYYKTFPLLLAKVLEIDIAWGEDYQKKLYQIWNSITVQDFLDNKEEALGSKKREEAQRQKEAYDFMETLHKYHAVYHVFPDVWNLPTVSQRLYGRQKILSHITQLLNQETFQGPLVLWGPEGIGCKSLAYSYAYQNAFRFTIGSRINAGTRERLLETLSALAQSISLPIQDDLVQLAKNVLDYFAQRQDRFLIIENFNPTVLDFDLIPSRGRIVVTSHELSSLSEQVVNVPPLDLEDAADLLMDPLALIKSSDRTLAEQIVTELGRVPQNLQQASLYLSAHPFITLTEFLEFCREIPTFTKGHIIAWQESHHEVSLKRNPSLPPYLLYRDQKSTQPDVPLISDSDLLYRQFSLPLLDQFLEGFKSFQTQSPTVLIAYAWSESNNLDVLRKIERLRHDLVRAGFKTKIDYLDWQHEDTSARYYDRMLQISDHIILIGSPSLKEGREAPDVSYLLSALETRSAIPLLLDGDFSVFPQHYMQVLIEDLRSLKSYYENFYRVIIGGIEKKVSQDDARAKQYIEEFKNIELTLQEKEETDAARRELLAQKLSDAKKLFPHLRSKEEIILRAFIDQRGRVFPHKISSSPWVFEEEVTHFTGRAAELEKLREYLTLVENDDISVIKKVVIRGLGGMGKSQLALAHANESRARYRFGWVCNAASVMTLAESYRQIGESVGLDLSDKSEEILISVRKWLEDPSHAGWLLTVDNADQPKLIHPYLPERGGALLITSRSEDWAEEYKILELGQMERLFSVNFLQKSTGLMDEKEADDISELLGDLPLALGLAAVYMRENPSETLASYKKRIQETGAEDAVLKTWKPTLEAIEKLNPQSILLLQTLAFCDPDDIPLYVLEEWGHYSFKTSCVKLDQLTRFLPEFCKTHQLLALFSHKDKMGKILEPLLRYSMIHQNTQKGFDIHRLVQRAIQQSLDEKTAQSAYKTVALIVSGKTSQEAPYFSSYNNDAFSLSLKGAFFFSKHDYTTWAFIKRMMPHLEAVLNHHFLKTLYRGYVSELHKLSAEIQEVFSNFFQAIISYKNVLVLYPRDSIFINEPELGYKDLSEIITSIANIYGFDLHRHQDELDFLLETLKPYQNTDGTYTPQADMLSNRVALLQNKLGDPEKSIDSLESVLKRKEHEGCSDAELIEHLDKIAVVLGELKNYDQQAFYCDRHVAIVERSAGGNSFEFVRALYTVADFCEPSACKPSENIEKALEYLLRAFMICEHHYQFWSSEKSELFKPAEYINYISASISSIYRKMGYPLSRDSVKLEIYLSIFQKELEFLERVLVFKEKIYGPTHSEIALALNSLVQVYESLDRIDTPLRNLETRIKYLKRILTIQRENNFEEEISNTLSRLGDASQHLGSYDQAVEFFKEALSLNEKKFGPDHPDNLVEKIGDVYVASQQYEKSLEWLESSLSSQEKREGPNAAHLVSLITNIARIHSHLGHHEKSKEFQQRLQQPKDPFTFKRSVVPLTSGTHFEDTDARLKKLEVQLETQIKALGPDDLNLTEIMDQIVLLCLDMKHMKKYFEYSEKVHEIREKFFGSKNEKVRDSLYCLAQNYSHDGRYKDAVRCFERLLEVNKVLYGPNSSEVIKTLTSLSNTYKEFHQYDKVIEVLESILTIQSKIKGPESLEVLETLECFAQVYGVYGLNEDCGLKDFEKQITYLKRILPLQEKIHGPLSRNVVDTIRTMAFRYHYLNNPQEKLNSLGRILEIYENGYQVEHPNITQRLLEEIAATCAYSQNYEAQVKYLQQGLVLQEKANVDKQLIINIFYGILNACHLSGNHDTLLTFYERLLAYDTSPDALTKHSHSLQINAAFEKIEDAHQHVTSLEKVFLIHEKDKRDKDKSIASLTLKRIADVYGKLGNLEKQQECSERSLSLFEQSTPPNYMGMALILSQRTKEYGTQGNHDKHVVSLCSLLSVCSKMSVHSAKMNSFSDFMWSGRMLGGYRHHITYLTDLLLAQERDESPDYFSILSTLYQLSVMYGMDGQDNSAKQISQRILETIDKIPEAKAAELAKTLFQLSDFYEEFGLFTEKKMKYYELACTLCEKVYSAESSELVDAYSKIVELCIKKNDREKRLKYALKILSIKEKVYGVDHPEVGNALITLESVYWDLGQYKENLSCCLRILAIREKEYSPRHLQVSKILHSIGMIHGQLEDYPHQEEFLKKALDIKEEVYSNVGGQHWETGITLSGLGEAYKNLSNFEESEKCLLRAITLFETTLPRDQDALLVTSRAQRRLGETYHAQKNLRKAQELLEKALETQSTLGMILTNNPEVALTLRSLGEMLKDQGEYGKAKENIELAFKIQEKVLGRDHPDTLKTKEIQRKMGFL